MFFNTAVEPRDMKQTVEALSFISFIRYMYKNYLAKHMRTHFSIVKPFLTRCPKLVRVKIRFLVVWYVPLLNTNQP